MKRKLWILFGAAAQVFFLYTVYQLFSFLYCGGGDLFGIEPTNPYPEDYEETVAQAVRERDRAYRPPLKASVPDSGSYETVFLGFPIWGETAPPVIRSFLSQHDLSGTRLVPFITHGGYGQGRSMNVVREHAPRARILDPFIMEADQERRTRSHCCVNRFSRAKHRASGCSLRFPNVSWIKPYRRASLISAIRSTTLPAAR